MFPEGEDRSYFLFIKHLGSWADLSQDAIDLDHDLSLAIEVLRTYDAKCSVSGDAVHRRAPWLDRYLERHRPHEGRRIGFSMAAG
jgi:hypothetical protein